MAKIKKRTKQSSQSPFRDYWSKNNYLLIGLGLLTLIIGFLIMGQGEWDNPISLTVSPIVLLLAYIVIFPLAILYKKKKNNQSEAANDSSQDNG